MSSWIVGRIKDGLKASLISLLLCAKNSLLAFEKYDTEFVQMKI